ncbi:MAG: hypothetical protein AABX04_02695 [Nanoarchaeota archaeon]
MSEWIIREHPDFFKDLDSLSTKDLEIFYKKKQKIKENPLREKHLNGGENCYREPITKNIRLIYYVKEEVIWLLVIDKHDTAYAAFRKRLYSL